VSTTEEKKVQFRRAHEEVLNPGAVSAVAEVIAPDFINHEAPPGRARGPESMRGLTTMLRTAFFDLRFAIEGLVAEGDIVAGRLTMSGTHEGPPYGYAADRECGAPGPHALCALPERQGRGGLGGEGRSRHDAATRRHPGAGAKCGTESLGTPALSL
jgi:predicted ester cyclase